MHLVQRLRLSIVLVVEHLVFAMYLNFDVFCSSCLVEHLPFPWLLLPLFLAPSLGVTLPWNFDVPHLHLIINHTFT